MTAPNRTADNLESVDRFTMTAETRPSLLNVYLVDAVSTAFGVLYALLNREAPPLVTLFIRFATMIAAVSWFRRYLGHAKLPLPYDWGFFFGIGWPVLIPVYAGRVNGWRGWRVVVRLFGLIVAPTFIAAMVRAFANAGP